MVLVDTSVWVDYLRKGDESFSHLLNQGQVCMHPMIIGELACGNWQNRQQLLELWQNLPKAKEASHAEAMHVLEKRRLMGKGIGYVDLHLLSATLMSDNTQLWTRDRCLAQIAGSLGIAVSCH